jgi:6-phosphogluconolactonase (cycloisomerase 2 family)
MRRKPTRLALAAMSILCTAILIACNCPPTLRFITVSPTDASIFIGIAPDAGKKVAFRSKPKSSLKSAGKLTPRQGVATSCGTLQYSATAFFSNGTQSDATSTVTWSSSTPTTATIDGSGLAAGLAGGTTTIGAVLTGISGSTSLNVDVITAIDITPKNQTIPLGSTDIPQNLQFTATATFTTPDGNPDNTQDISTLVTWGTDNADVATIDANGLATSVGKGATNVFASFCSIDAPTTTLTVGNAIPFDLIVSPAAPTVAVGGTQLFTVQERWTDGTLHPAGPVTWSSDTPTVLSINANSGLATGIAAGTATVTATENAAPSLTGSTTATVQPAVARFAYLANVNDFSISEYGVNASTGTFLPLGKFPAPEPQQVLVHPSGLYVYVIDATSFIEVYNVNPVTGALTINLALGPYQAGSGATNKGVIDPTGSFIYVAEAFGTNTIFGYKISAADGSLTAIAGAAPFSTNLSDPLDLLVDHAGGFLYAVNNGSSTVSEYSIAAGTGVLAALANPNASIPTGANNSYSTIDPANAHLYVPNTDDNTVSVYTITSGVLAADGTAAPVGTVSAWNAAIDPTGKFIYILDSPDPTSGTPGTVSAFNLNSDGTFGAAIGTPAPVGLAPNGIAIDTGGNFLVADNNFSNTISLFTFGTGGALNTPSTLESGATPQFLAFYNSAFGVAVSASEVVAANPDSGNLVAFNASSGALTADGGSPYATFLGDDFVAASSLSNLVVTGGDATNKVAAFSADPTQSTTLTALNGSPYTIPGTVTPSIVFMDSTGKSAYGVDTTNGALYGFNFHSGSNSFVPIPGSSPVAALTGVQGLAGDPQGTLLYALANNAITPLLIVPNQSGALQKNPTEAITGNWTAGLIDASGEYLITFDPTAKILRAFEISPLSGSQIASDGALTADGAPLTLTGTPSSIAIDPLGRYVLVVDATAGTISAFSFTATVVTTPFAAVGTPITTPAGAGSPGQVSFDATGGFLFVALEGTPATDPAVPGAVAVYSVSVTGQTPTFTAVAGSPFPAGDTTTGLGTAGVAVINQVQ